VLPQIMMSSMYKLLHRIVVHRRLVKALGQIHNSEPLRFPISDSLYYISDVRERSTESSGMFVKPLAIVNRHFPFGFRDNRHWDQAIAEDGRIASIRTNSSIIGRSRAFSGIIGRGGHKRWSSGSSFSKLAAKTASLRIAFT
jgi:hypothetical protein